MAIARGDIPSARPEMTFFRCPECVRKKVSPRGVPRNKDGLFHLARMSPEKKYLFFFIHGRMRPNLFIYLVYLGCTMR